jgi:hypothetical protein
MKKLWFYPAQAAVKDYLTSKYSDYNCNWQDVCKETVHENYTCWEKEGNKAVNIHVVMYKTGFIQFYTPTNSMSF